MDKSLTDAFLYPSIAASTFIELPRVCAAIFLAERNQFDEKTMHWKIKLLVASILIRLEIHALF